jgi:hypothetical protein
MPMVISTSSGTRRSVIVGQEGVVELLHIDRAQHQPRVAEQVLARRQAEIEGAIDDVGAAEPV